MSFRHIHIPDTTQTTIRRKIVDGSSSYESDIYDSGSKQSKTSTEGCWISGNTVGRDSTRSGRNHGMNTDQTEPKSACRAIKL